MRDLFDTEKGAGFFQIGNRIVVSFAAPDDIGWRPYIQLRRQWPAGWTVLALAWLHRALWIGVRHK